MAMEAVEKKQQEAQVKKKTTKGPKEPKATKKNEDSKVTKTTVVRMLPCKLTEKERAKLAEDLESNMTKIESIEQQKKTADDGFKKDIGLLEEAQGKLRTMIRTGAEEREVKCEEVTDYVHGEVRVTRLDTKETFSKRNLTKTEAQLPLLPKDKPAGKLLAMDGGKGKDSQFEDCEPCHGTGKIPMGEPPLPTKCEDCNGSGKGKPRIPAPLTAKLGDVAAQHEKNKADAEAATQVDTEGHPEVEKLIKARKKGGKKTEGNGVGVDTTPPEGCDF